MSQNTLENSEMNGLDELNEIPQRSSIYKKAFIRILKEEPLIFGGISVAVGAFSYGLWSFYRGNQRVQSYMMNLRLVGHYVALFAILRGLRPKSKDDTFDNC